MEWMARSLVSFGNERRGAVDGSVIAFITFSPVDFAAPCSPVKVSMGYGPQGLKHMMINPANIGQSSEVERLIYFLSDSMLPPVVGYGSAAIPDGLRNFTTF